MSIFALLGRLCFSLVFILGSFGHFTKEYINYGASAGIPIPSIMVPLSGVIALLGGLSILLGYKTRYGAVLIIIFLIPVTLMMHNFWIIGDPVAAKMQEINFMKNLGLLGGAFLLTYFGSGPLSFDRD